MSSKTHKYDYAFGMSGMRTCVKKRYDNAVNTLFLFLKNKISPQEVKLEAISELKGMFNRSLRKDQPDWFTVYDKLGYPPINEMNSIVSRLVKLRKSLKEHDFKQALLIREDLVNSTLVTYLNQWKKNKSIPVHWGISEWLYILSRKEEPDILKIGKTIRPVKVRVKEINSATGVLWPLSVRGIFPVENAAEAEDIVFRRLIDYRIRMDREFFEIRFRDAVRIITEEIFHLLTRTQGEIRTFDAIRGYGFITCQKHGNRDIFVHQSQIHDEHISIMQQGQRVKFDINHTDKGLEARRVTTIYESRKSEVVIKDISDKEQRRRDIYNDTAAMAIKDAIEMLETNKTSSNVKWTNANEVLLEGLRAPVTDVYKDTVVRGIADTIEALEADKANPEVEWTPEEEELLEALKTPSLEVAPASISIKDSKGTSKWFHLFINMIKWVINLFR